MLFFYLFLAASGLSLARTLSSGRITNLPGLQPGIDDLFTQYSSFLPVSNDKHLHYWFIESNNVGGAKPLVLWLSGGPGCSSLDATLSQTGPFTVSKNGYNLTRNDYGWSQFAHILYLDAPVGVGFSYADRPIQNYNDEEVTYEVYEAVNQFLRNAHPDHKNDSFYIYAEGYASVIGVHLAKKFQSDWKVKFKGLIIEGGFMNEVENTNSLIEYSYYHGLISPRLWGFLQEYCCQNGTCSYYNPPKPCLDYVAAAKTIFGQLNMFDLLSYCRIPPHIEENALGISSLHCINQTAETSYLNNPHVQSAIHVENGPVSEWTPCSKNVSSLYHPSQASILPLIANLTQFARVAVLTGDADLEFNYLGVQRSIESLNLEVHSDWHPWCCNDTVAGFSTSYSQGKLSVSTVKGAGHFIARSQPEPLSRLVSAFLNDESTECRTQ